MQKMIVCGLLCAVAAGLARASEDPSAASWLPAQYEFNYAVNDPLTGDLKDQQETRSGDNVAGYYRTLDADGLVRTVRYQADAVNGFRAEVVREPATGGAAAAAPGLAAKASAVQPAVAPAPAAYHRSLTSAYPYAYQPYSPNAVYQPYSSRAAYQPYSSRASYQPYSPNAAYQPYSPYAAYQPYSPYAAYRPYSPAFGDGARYPYDRLQYARK